MYVKNECVRVKERFWDITPTMPLGINEAMRKYAGKEYIVKLSGADGIKTRYKIYDAFHEWVWDENWLEPVFEIKDVYTEELDLLFKGD